MVNQKEILIKEQKMEQTKETIDLYKKRVANCIKTANMSEKDSWAYNFWMQTASKITKKLERMRKPL
tara:strand:- start:77 stop:277 length:201 start_codon:yes stop_codon:yes gene_type:complete